MLIFVFLIDADVELEMLILVFYTGERLELKELLKESEEIRKSGRSEHYEDNLGGYIVNLEY